MFYQDFSQNASDWAALSGSMTQTTAFTPTYRSNAGVGQVGVVSNTGPFTRWRWNPAAGSMAGNASQFAPSGYVLQIAMYLDTTVASGPVGNDLRVDYTVAVSNALTPAVHAQDFMFNFGFYNETNSYGSGRRFIATASNNGGTGGNRGWPTNPARSPQVLAGPDDSGWYNFQHRFYPAGTGWYCDLTVWSESCGNKVANWTLGPVHNLGPVDLGPPRYGWFVGVHLPNNALKVAQQVYNILL